MRRSVGRMLWGLVSASFSLTFVQADCETPTPIIATCPGSTVQSVRFLAQGSCGPAAFVTITVPTAGLCALAVGEGTNSALPIAGMFEDNANTTHYDIGEGNWVLQNEPTGMIGGNGGLRCMSGTINAKGGLDLDCEITLCSTIGEDLEPTCVPSGSCVTHLLPESPDAGIVIDDAGFAIFPDAGPGP